MKAKNILHKAAAAAAAAIMCMSAIAPSVNVYAQNYTPVHDDKAQQMEKYLIMKQDANVPQTTFTFTADGNLSPITGTADTMPVKPGSMASGTPVIGTATFTPTTPTFTSPQPLISDLGGDTTGRNDNVTLNADEKYARATVDVDFRNVSFSEPGVYRWKISETIPTGQSITADDTDGKYLDVYVEDNNGQLAVTGYVLHNDNGPVKKDGTHLNSNTKDGGFSNHYSTQNLTFGKQVTGNQGSKDKYFKFHLKIEGALPSTVYTVDVSDADASISANPNMATTVITSTVNNATSLTAGNTGSVEAAFYLQHDQSILVKGLPKGATYTVTENKEDYVSTDGATYTRGSSQITANGATSGTIGTADVATGFTNSNNGIVPTGYFSIPGILVIGAALAGFGIREILKKKKRAIAE